MPKASDPTTTGSKAHTKPANTLKRNQCCQACRQCRKRKMVSKAWYGAAYLSDAIPEMVCYLRSQRSTGHDLFPAMRAVPARPVSGHTPPPLAISSNRASPSTLFSPIVYTTAMTKKSHLPITMSLPFAPRPSHPCSPQRLSPSLRPRT
ncbi:hypothetical protein AG1IA_07359 [Rhizoctonia solani AG-1 IA]|uniref:Uncharacterized protein n=1 Tax=Thanatephorus cucumeris (strain AG1-IA) TaxID=983506 RepID=L8WL00_THACA|nr:hypothetical protein AG1IA_07359 [Rhizoctonia solani AG-1 IA]